MILRSSNSFHDARFKKTLEFLTKHGLEPEIHYWDREEKVSKMNNPPSNCHFYQRAARNGEGTGNLRGQVGWQLFMLVHLIKEKPSLVYACDLDSAIVPSLIKLIMRFKIIFDEYDSLSSRSGNFGFLSKRIFKNLEKYVWKRSDLVVVANDSRVRREKDVVIRNLPSTEFVRVKPISTLPLISYVGIFQDDRGLPELVSVVEKSNDWEAIIAGFGPMKNEIEKGAAARVRILGKVDEHEIRDIFSKSWLTYAAYNPLFLNNVNNASTKILASLCTGTPVVVNRGMNYSEIVERLNLGWVIDFNNESQLSEALEERLMWGSKELSSFRFRAQEFIKSLQNEQQEALSATGELSKLLRLIFSH